MSADRRARLVTLLETVIADLGAGARTKASATEALKAARIDERLCVHAEQHGVIWQRSKSSRNH